MNISAMQQRDPRNVSLQKYADVGRLFAGDPSLDNTEAYDALVAALWEWTQRMGIPGLAQFGIDEAAIPAIVADSRGSSMQTNPIVLTDEEIADLVRERIT
jgi:alcohol dehydrogenase